MDHGGALGVQLLHLSQQGKSRVVLQCRLRLRLPLNTFTRPGKIVRRMVELVGVSIGISYRKSRYIKGFDIVLGYRIERLDMSQFSVYRNFRYTKYRNIYIYRKYHNFRYIEGIESFDISKLSNFSLYVESMESCGISNLSRLSIYRKYREFRYIENWLSTARVYIVYKGIGDRGCARRTMRGVALTRARQCDNRTACCTLFLFSQAC